MGTRGPRPRYTERLSVYLSPAVHATLRQHAEDVDALVSEVVRRALAEHLANPPAAADASPAVGSPPWNSKVGLVLRPATLDALTERAKATRRPVAVEGRVAIHRYLQAAGVDLPTGAPDLLAASA